MLDELLILKKIKGGDIKAFEELFRRYYFPLCCYAAGIIGQMEVAEEIVEELFYVLWKERERLQIFQSLKVTCIERLVINLCSIANTRKFGTDTVKLY